MSVKNVKPELGTKTNSLITSIRLSEQAEALRASESSPLGSTVPWQDFKSFAQNATVGSPQSKTSFGEAAAEAYAVKASKLRPSLLPPEVVIEGARAMEFGAKKYGVDQWKTVDMQPREFIDALERHLLAYKQGETRAADSQVHHLGHIIANCGILLSRFEGKETK